VEPRCGPGPVHRPATPHGGTAAANARRCRDDLRSVDGRAFERRVRGCPPGLRGVSEIAGALGGRGQGELWRILGGCFAVLESGGMGSPQRGGGLRFWGAM
jgi:hypothetical protein